MSKKKIVQEKEASVVDEQPEAVKTNGYNQDYTRYFYRQIDNLWSAVKNLQTENDGLRAKLTKAQIVFTEGV